MPTRTRSANTCRRSPTPQLCKTAHGATWSGASEMMIDQAWDQRGLLITKLQQVLDFNYARRDQKVVWPDADPIPPELRGQPVNRDQHHRVRQGPLPGLAP
jgi:hypothetical protein